MVPAPDEKDIFARADATLAAIDEAKGDKTYFDLIDPADQDFFNRLVVGQIKEYPDMPFPELQEMLARNYLARVKAFENIVADRGFEEAAEAVDANAEIAALTRSGSYVFADKAALTPVGGSFVYFKIQGRKSSVDDGLIKGVKVTLPVQVGKNMDLSEGGVEHTSSLKRLFVRKGNEKTDGGNSIIDVSAEVRGATQVIDEKSLRRVLAAREEKRGLPQPE